MVEAAASTDHNLSKHSEINKVIYVLETSNKTRALNSISEMEVIIIQFENLEARFGLNLYAKYYADHKGFDA